MINEFVLAWYANLDRMRAFFSEKHPYKYRDIVTEVVKMLHDELEPNKAPDPERITEINHGEWQGTLLYVIGDTGYQPNTYWYVKVRYGSCSGCDTLKGIREYACGKKPTEEQVNQYMQLALNIIQELRVMK